MADKEKKNHDHDNQVRDINVLKKNAAASGKEISLKSSDVEKNKMISNMKG